MIVLGLDVSSSSTGWAVLKHGRFYGRKSIDYGWIRPPVKLPPAQKLSYFRAHLHDLPGVVDYIGIEDTFFLKNPKTLKVLSRFAGVALESCWDKYAREPEIIPVKSLRTVWGTQDKKEIFDLVIKKYKLKDWSFNKHNDVTDAIAVAFYVHKTL